MDNILNLALEILIEYKEIDDCNIIDSGISFILHDSKYAMFWIDDNRLPIISTVDNNADYPHFLYDDVSIRGQIHRSICLFDSGTIIEYIFSKEDKIRICIERLIELVELSDMQIEKEFQKEFLFYWKRACPKIEKYSKNEYQLFLDNEENYQWLEQQYFKKNVIRITKKERYFNDIKSKNFSDKIPVLYLPIIDPRGITPPINSHPWGSIEISNIVSGVTYQHITDEAYRMIASTSYSLKEILMVFRLNTLIFGCVVQFKNSGVAKLINKFETQIDRVIPISISRCDFEFLNHQIGNSTSDKNIVVVGSGSLGSYVSSELVRAGYKNITIIDKDKYEYENCFRHRIQFFSSGYAKSVGLSVELNAMHPELNIQFCNKYLAVDNMDELRICEADLVIFTVGSSDAQLMLNKAFFERKAKVPVYYLWLESDGETSHLAIINDFESGCFECLYTDEEGELCNNTINTTTDVNIEYIRNGCGGTRIPYGNKTLLTATTLLLKAMKDKPSCNLIYSYYNDQISVRDFPKNERCNCCGVC